ncbi:DMT family transporter [Cohaesibacter haloalkalitolerans]|uniref:DMT family transporter n=1 Tax=Cohaesibacter haloalkalitolerans TaxID=1162980 RepID=UPI000E65977B|nr:DMT family transporter [Cohaesibacter haloalkalitolerans]
MPTWILITISAAFLQNIRSVLQKHLKGALSTTGATFVRFAFGVPFALLYLFGYAGLSGATLPSFNGPFLFWVMVAALTQIGAQFLLVHLFSFRNFTVGTAYSRTEPAQAALFAFLFFSETIRTSALVAIGVAVFGVMLISVARTTLSVRTLITSTFSRTALIGLASGSLFGVAAAGYRQASLSLVPDMVAPDYILQASFTLATAILIQTVLMGLWITVREREEWGRVARAWKPSLATGFVGASASFGWFMAMTLQQAALVKALAQVEMLFTFASSVFIFKEKINRLELIGCGLIVCGVLILVLG